MKISDRLIKIASFIKKDANIADVGADHGLLEKYLIDKCSPKSIFAIENKSGPFKNLEANLKGYNVTLSLSDGISEIPDYDDTVVIAGMGGNLIVDILRKDISKLKNVEQIVIDAHRDLELVRREVTSFGYKIEKESIVYENSIYYFVISFIRGKATYDDETFEWGCKIKDDPLFEEYRSCELGRLKENLALYLKSNNPSKEEIEKRESKIRRLETL